MVNSAAFSCFPSDFQSADASDEIAIKTGSLLYRVSCDCFYALYGVTKHTISDSA